MSLPELFKKIKDFVGNAPDLSREAFVVLSLVLTGVGAFMLGRLSYEDEARNRELRIVSSATATPVAVSPIREQGNTTQTGNVAFSGMYVGSRSGSVYHLPTCPGAKQIKEENKIWFSGKQDAAAKGYKPAANCKGI